ncbi:MAG TPA: hypothetical protein VKA76_03655 [Gammaproteobacteria bacterium]|nr:hypothetical protein [Gammaproteobacteria bacterium]
MMARTPAECALGRLIAYLQLAGVPPTAQVSRTAVDAVRAALDDNGGHMLPRTMDQLDGRFSVPAVEVPPPCPVMTRGSIHYDSD